MKYNEPESLLCWIHHQDGRVETNFTPSQHVRKQDELAEEPSQEPKEPHKYHYDKLIAESGFYGMWWILWKRIHPEWALYPEQPKEPVIKPTPKPKPKLTLEKISCRRCNHSWTPRSKEPPVQCSRCHSPYWNRDRVERK
jgi:hypothetical protein